MGKNQDFGKESQKIQNKNRKILQVNLEKSFDFTSDEENSEQEEEKQSESEDEEENIGDAGSKLYYYF